MGSAGGAGGDTGNRRIYLLTGVAAAGKSTVADLLAQRFPRAVHVRGDVFRRMIVTGRAEPTPEMPSAAMEQLRLRYRVATTVADVYFDAGFVVVLQDVIVGRLLSEVVALLKSRPLFVVVLAPRRDVVAARAAAREKDAYAAWTVDQLYDVFERETPRIGLWLDSSDQTPDETVDEILNDAKPMLTP